MRWPREPLSRKGLSGSNPDPGAYYNHKITQIFTQTFLERKFDQRKWFLIKLFPKKVQC